MFVPYIAWVFPIISAFTWLGMLLAMLIVWLAEGSPHYSSMAKGQSIAYISDVGAEGLKPLFIAGCSVTTVFLDLAFIAERYLRHAGRLVPNTSVLEKLLSVVAILFGIAGTAGLILLSVFDTFRHPTLHDIFLLVFMVGYVLSAICLCIEYQRLGHHFRRKVGLQISFWIKLIFIVVEVGLSVGFAVCLYANSRENTGAVLEWVIAVIFSFWILSFLFDLLPAVKQNSSRVDEFTGMEGGLNGRAEPIH